MTISKLKRLDDSGLWSPKVLSKWRLSVKASTPVSDGLIPQNKIHRRTLASFALENSIFFESRTTTAFNSCFIFSQANVYQAKFHLDDLENSNVYCSYIR